MSDSVGRTLKPLCTTKVLHRITTVLHRTPPYYLVSHLTFSHLVLSLLSQIRSGLRRSFRYEAVRQRQ